MKKPILSNIDMADLTWAMAKVLLLLACFMFIFSLVADLFGGKFFPLSLIRYGCWIGIAFIMKYGVRYTREKIRMKLHKWYFICIFVILSTFIWFPNYLGIIMSVLIMFGLMASYKSQGKQGWQDEQ